MLPVCKSKFKVVYRRTWNKVQRNEIYAEIARLKETYTVFGIAYDKVGVGDSVKFDLMEKGLFYEEQILNLSYSVANKSDVYCTMKAIFESRRLNLPDTLEAREQILALRYVRLEGEVHLKDANIFGEKTIHKYKIHHENERTHDDEPDALANCLYLASRNLYVPVTVTIINATTIPKRELGYKLIVCNNCSEYYYEEREHECVLE